MAVFIRCHSVGFAAVHFSFLCASIVRSALSGLKVMVIAQIIMFSDLECAYIPLA